MARRPVRRRRSAKRRARARNDGIIVFGLATAAVILLLLALGWLLHHVLLLLGLLGVALAVALLVVRGKAAASLLPLGTHAVVMVESNPDEIRPVPAAATTQQITDLLDGLANDR
ncbi:hypothetical protein [Kitasatospora griseola]